MGRTLAGLLMIVCAGCASSASGAQSHRGGVTAVWRPDINSAQRTVTTQGTAAQASDLIHDLAAAPPLPKGPIACPAALGVEVGLTLTSGGIVEHARVLLTGCPEIDIDGGRQLTSAIAADLRPLAPPRWQRYLRDY
jgi:hypothetical protein